MKRQISWLVVSGVMVLSLVLSACAPKPPAEVTPAPKEAAPTTVKEEVAEKQVVAPTTVEKPRYGGTLVVTGGTTTFLTEHLDQAYASFDWRLPRNITNEYLLTGDWTRGQAGTKEVLFRGGGFAPQGIPQHTGLLTQSYEIPDNQTLIFHIRQGVHWHNKPPVNGREMDADDVARSIQHIYLNPKVPSTYATRGAPSKVLSATATDKWTVVVKVEDVAAAHLEELGSQNVVILPRESLDLYGNMEDWRNSLGTGPFILTDFVSGVSATMAKNSNYWMTNPIGPGKGDKLPYIDKINALVIPDVSTQVSALRTGKVDHVTPISPEDKDGLIRTNPQIKTDSARLGTPVLNMFIKTQGTSPLWTPLANQRVRQALAMAIDFQSIINDYYKGQSIWQFTPAAGNKYYTKPEDMPEILERVHGFTPEEAQMVKKMYTYHPEEAKKLLAEAGYPNGFKTKVLITNVPKTVDIFSIVVEYWKKNLNVDLELDIKTSAIQSTTSNNRAFDAITSGGSVIDSSPEKWRVFAPATMEGPRHLSNWNDFKDPVVNAAMERAFQNYGDIELRSQIQKEAIPYMLWLGYHIPLPMAYEYVVWQPWLKEYHGEGEVGYKQPYGWTRFAWLDKDLKAKITGKK